MAGYWLLYTDPVERSWDEVVKASRDGFEWSGLRDDEVFDLLTQMQQGDLALVYHAGDERRLVGIAKTLGPAHPDKTDDSGQWLSIDVYAFIRLINPVGLTQLESDPRLAGLLVAEGDTSPLQPVDPEHWQAICALAGMPRTIERG
jgi:predicted RNA-binding protein with PUA-like domain